MPQRKTTKGKKTPATDHRKAAAAFLAALNSGIPDALLDYCVAGIHRMSGRLAADISFSDDEKTVVSKLTDLFERTELVSSVSLDPDPPTLGQLIAAVFAHPACPVEIRNGLGEGNSLLFNRLTEGDGPAVWESAEYNDALIAEHLRRQVQEDETE